MKYIRRPSNRILKDALDAFGYILPMDKDTTSKEFAQLINHHSSSVQAKALAEELKECCWSVRRERFSSTLFLTTISRTVIENKGA